MDRLPHPLLRNPEIQDNFEAIEGEALNTTETKKLIEAFLASLGLPIGTKVTFGSVVIALKTGEIVATKLVKHGVGKEPKVVLIAGGPVTVTESKPIWGAQGFSATEFTAVLRIPAALGTETSVTGYWIAIG